MELGPLILQNGANEDDTIYRRTVHRILKKAEVDMSIKDICRSGGLKRSTFYKWRSRFGGMKACDAAKLRYEKCLGIWGNAKVHSHPNGNSAFKAIGN